MQIEAGLESKVGLIVDRAPETLVGALGIEFTELYRKRVVGTMPVDRRTKQPFGLLHGGASVALAESLCSVGAWLNLNSHTLAAVGVEINANHIKSVTEGIVKGVAVPIKIGKTMQFWEIKIYDATDNLVCISRCTLAVIKQR